jgi:methyl-accepting chemotaxis protein
MMDKNLPQVSPKWKGGIGLTMLAALLFSGGMQVQSWRDSDVPATLTAACDRRVLLVRDSFTKQAAERADVVTQVKEIAKEIQDTAAQIKKDVNDIQANLAERKPVTDKIARKVDQIDNKASAAAVEARKASVAAAKAAQVTEANSAAPVKSISKINKSIEEVNKK